MKHVLILLLAIAFVACNGQKSDNQNEPTTSTEEKANEKVASNPNYNENGYAWSDTVPNIFTIPDSILQKPEVRNDKNFSIEKIWTPEQKALATLIMRSLIDDVDIIHGKPAFKITREEFAAKGIPAPYYDMFSFNLYQFSKGKSDIQIVQLWEERRNQICKQYGFDKK